MKKMALVFIFVLILSTSSYALNPVDAMLYKKVKILLHHKRPWPILVNKITGEVKYVWRDKDWVLLQGNEKEAYQALYDSQYKTSK